MLVKILNEKMFQFVLMLLVLLFICDMTATDYRYETWLETWKSLQFGVDQSEMNFIDWTAFHVVCPLFLAAD